MGVSFAHDLARHGDRVALVCGDGRAISYRDLAAEVDAYVADFGPERRLVLWEAHAEPDAIAQYLAALKAGHPVLPVPPLDANPHAARHRAQLIDTYRPDVPTPYHPDLALLLATSGSTGASKLVRLSAANLAANAGSIADYQNLRADDRTALILPLHYAYGLSVLHAHLSVGASLYLGTPHILAPDFVTNIRAARCTNLAGVPYSFELLEQIGFRENDLPDLRFMSVAGGRLAPDLVRLYAGHLARRGTQFFVMYGQTEATSRIAYLPPHAALAHPDCIGEAIPGGTLSLIDDQGHSINAIGQAGELVYRGPNVMMSYATCRDDLARGAELVELRTGDLAERTAAGFYRITGRRSRFSKIAGLRLGHDHLERLFEVPGRGLAVTGDDREIRVACSGIATAAEIAALRTEIAAACALNPTFIRIVPVDELPRGANGKLDYGAVAALFDDRQDTARPESVHDAFAATFAPRPLRPDDSFVRLGGDSLSFVQLSLALEEILGSLPRDWEQRSIAELTGAQPVPAKQLPLWQNWFAAWRPLDTSHVLRALAILFIVLHHATLWEIAGGAATLMVLVGYNLARFQGGLLLSGRIGVMLRATLRPLLLYYAVLLGYCFYTGRYPWQSLVLLGNLGIDGYSTMPTPLVAYWFIEAYAQVMLVVAGLFAWAPLRRFVARHSFAAGLLCLVFAILARELQPQLWNAGEMRAFATPRIFYLAALGWCLYFADTGAKRAFMTLLIVALFLGLPWYEEAKASILWVRAGVVIGSSLILLWCANILLPRHLAQILASVAAASYCIYLFHNVPFFLWLEDAALAKPYDDIIHFVLGLALGLAVHHAVQRLSRWLRNTPLAHTLWRGPRRGLAPGE
nr:AMP-binding protein [uncultured Dongia sp.]